MQAPVRGPEPSEQTPALSAALEELPGLPAAPLPGKSSQLIGRRQAWAKSEVAVPLPLLILAAVLLAAVGAMFVLWVMERRRSSQMLAAQALVMHPPLQRPALPKVDKSFLVHVLNCVEAKRAEEARAAESKNTGPPAKVSENDSSDDASSCPRPEMEHEPESEADVTEFVNAVDRMIQEDNRIALQQTDRAARGNIRLQQQERRGLATSFGPAPEKGQKS